MASPKYVLFFIYHKNTGAPLTTQTPSFYVYKSHGGTALTQPTIVNLGDGAYGFIPAFTTDQGIVWEVNTGTDGNPARIGGYIRPEDYNMDTAATQASVDNVQTTLDNMDMANITTKVNELHTYLSGKWEIKTTGADANHMIFYAADGTTVLRKFLLSDSNGVPTYVNPFKRTPV